MENPMKMDDLGALQMVFHTKTINNPHELQKDRPETHGPRHDHASSVTTTANQEDQMQTAVPGTSGSDRSDMKYHLVNKHTMWPPQL